MPAFNWTSSATGGTGAQGRVHGKPFLSRPVPSSSRSTHDEGVPPSATVRPSGRRSLDLVALSSRSLCAAAATAHTDQQAADTLRASSKPAAALRRPNGGCRSRVETTCFSSSSYTRPFVSASAAYVDPFDQPCLGSWQPQQATPQPQPQLPWQRQSPACPAQPGGLLSLRDGPGFGDDARLSDDELDLFGPAPPPQHRPQQWELAPSSLAQSRVALDADDLALDLMPRAAAGPHPSGLLSMPSRAIATPPHNCSDSHLQPGGLIRHLQSVGMECEPLMLPMSSSSAARTAHHQHRQDQRCASPDSCVSSFAPATSAARLDFAAGAAGTCSGAAAGLSSAPRIYVNELELPARPPRNQCQGAADGAHSSFSDGLFLDALRPATPRGSAPVRMAVDDPGLTGITGLSSTGLYFSEATLSAAEADPEIVARSTSHGADEAEQPYRCGASLGLPSEAAPVVGHAVSGCDHPACSSAAVLARGAELAPQAPPPSPAARNGTARDPHETAARPSEHIERSGSGGTGESVAADDSGLQEARSELIGAEYGSFMDETARTSAAAAAAPTPSGSMPPPPPLPLHFITARRADVRTQTMPAAGVDVGTQTSWGHPPVGSSRARATAAAKALHARRRRQQAEDRYQVAMRLIRKAVRKRGRRMQGAAAASSIAHAPLLGVPLLTQGGGFLGASFAPS